MNERGSVLTIMFFKMHIYIYILNKFRTIYSRKINNGYACTEKE